MTCLPASQRSSISRRCGPHWRCSTHLVSSPSVTKVRTSGRPASSPARLAGSFRLMRSDATSVSTTTGSTLGKIRLPGGTGELQEVVQLLVGLEDAVRRPVVDRLDRYDALSAENVFQGRSGTRAWHDMVLVVVGCCHVAP